AAAAGNSGCARFGGAAARAGATHAKPQQHGYDYAHEQRDRDGQPCQWQDDLGALPGSVKIAERCHADSHSRECSTSAAANGRRPIETEGFPAPTSACRPAAGPAAARVPRPRWSEYAARTTDV